ncbi:hypothetical protein IVA96_10395 [Bradyrhizobium sp. 159]|uniref:hypothetical protein n=1 Tax=Bradyrhizobium sp. 159 TaxID=2782632 RepID=UPI001FF7D87D|nr:hypothetical protein [Bradyrhizobium sp. 159]MCK1419806.1 hypothetical protein [Bradyrhizobium sp. CW12]MCK1617051.1 hypothetical protein [Bradyrhizobium sp. 159]
MKEILAHLELLRVQIADCERLQQSAKSPLRRDVYTRVLSRYKAIATELEQAIARLPPAAGTTRRRPQNRHEEK